MVSFTQFSPLCSGPPTSSTVPTPVVCSSFFPSKMEALGGYPNKSSSLKAKRLRVLLSMTVGVGCLFLLQTQLVKPRKRDDFYSFEVKDAKGRTVSLEKYRGKVRPHHHQLFYFLFMGTNLCKLQLETEGECHLTWNLSLSIQFNNWASFLLFRHLWL